MCLFTAHSPAVSLPQPSYPTSSAPLACPVLVFVSAACCALLSASPAMFSRLTRSGGVVAPLLRSNRATASSTVSAACCSLPRRSFAHLVPGTPLSHSQSQPLQHVDDLSSSEAAFGYNSTDPLLEENRLDGSQMADPTNRTFTYLMQGSAAFMYASFGRLAVMKFVSFLSASADVMAVSTIEVEIGAIAEGNATTVKWRGKPVFIRHRTAKELHSAVADYHAALRGPQTDAERFHDKPEWAVLIGVCTHLGCGHTDTAHEDRAHSASCKRAGLVDRGLH